MPLGITRVAIKDECLDWALFSATSGSSRSSKTCPLSSRSWPEWCCTDGWLGFVDLSMSWATAGATNRFGWMPCSLRLTYCNWWLEESRSLNFDLIACNGRFHRIWQWIVCKTILYKCDFYHFNIRFFLGLKWTTYRRQAEQKHLKISCFLKERIARSFLSSYSLSTDHFEKRVCIHQDRGENSLCLYIWRNLVFCLASSLLHLFSFWPAIWSTMK